MWQKTKEWMWTEPQNSSRMSNDLVMRRLSFSIYLKHEELKTHCSLVAKMLIILDILQQSMLKGTWLLNTWKLKIFVWSFSLETTLMIKIYYVILLFIYYIMLFIFVQLTILILFFFFSENWKIWWWCSFCKESGQRQPGILACIYSIVICDHSIRNWR